jgi:hypothetical protein
VIGKAIAGYRALGYEYIETDWWVSKEAQYATMPKHIKSLVVGEYQSHFCKLCGEEDEPMGHLVGSAEQALIQKILDQKISPGLYVMAGPCFRNEPKLDELHHRSFFKVELACVFLEGTLPSRGTLLVMNDAQTVHYNLGHVWPKTVSMPDGSGYDLERSLNGIGWVYGTGLALPRFTQAKATV